MIMMILMMIIIIVIIIAMMIMMIEITLIIAVVIINSPFQPGDFCTGFTAGIYQDICGWWNKYGRRTFGRWLWQLKLSLFW